MVPDGARGVDQPYLPAHASAPTLVGAHDLAQSTLDFHVGDLRPHDHAPAAVEQTGAQPNRLPGCESHTLTVDWGVRRAHAGP